MVEPFAPPGSPDALPPQGARAINSGTTWRLDVVHDLGLNHEGGTPGLAVYSASARQFPIRLEVLERHQLGSQSFLPLTGARSSWWWLQQVLRRTPRNSRPSTQPDVRAWCCTGARGTTRCWRWSPEALR
ncbi:ureidoglycolate lyase [Polaromonas sp. P1(28)-8]|nr:ureidoglycolate lyase [Polaromonas sp. P1(28)-8]